MIIDDEVGVREVLADAFKLAGFETVVAPDAMVALTLLRTTKPDLLVVDINMPMMDGFWGDRFGILSDPFGHRWTVATRKKNMTPDEIKKAGVDFMKEMSK